MRIKFLGTLLLSGLLGILVVSPVLAADSSTVMHRLEQRYKDDYRLYPVSEEEAAKLKRDDDIMSQMKLAGYYYYKEEYEKSYPIFKKYADEGDRHALYMLGISGLQWRGCERVKNDSEREVYVAYIREASDAGHPCAKYLMAVFADEGFAKERKDKNRAKQLYAEAKQLGMDNDAIVFQAKYDKAMAIAGYGRYGVKDTTGTLALASTMGVPVIRPEPLDPETNPTPELKALFEYLTKQYGTPKLLIGKFGQPQDVKTVETKSGHEITKYVYKDFTASYLGEEWVDITVKSGVRVLFNGLKINSSSNDLFAVIGSGEYLDAVTDTKLVLMDVTRSKEYAEFDTNINTGRVSYMRAYKVVQ